MKIAIIHLSDIHFKANVDQNAVFYRIDNISRAVLGYAKDIKFYFIVISGDIAFSGMDDEYAIAEDFLLGLIRKFNDNDIETKIVLVPGNHDCNFSENQVIRDTLIPQILSEGLKDDAIAEHCVLVQKNFKDFVTRLEGKFNQGSSTQPSNALSEIKHYKVGDTNIQFLLLNSAWISKIHEQQGIIFPIEKIQQTLECNALMDLTISVFHHPYIWFAPDNSKAFRKKVESLSDIILTGHEHDSDIFVRSKPAKENVEYLEGGVLQDKSSNRSEFNLLIIDMEQRQQTVYRFEWNPKQSIYGLSENKLEIPFVRNKLRKQLGFELISAFERDLRDLGIKFSHPSTDDISVDDIFVYPDLRRLYLVENQDLPKTIVREQIPQFIIDNKKVLIVGSDKSGKTVLAKKLFSVFVAKGFTCLVLNGESIKEYDENRVETYLKRSLEDTYINPDYNEFLQIEKSKKIIIIDDFHKSPLKAQYREKTINVLCSFSDTIIIFGNEQLRFNDLFLESEQDHLCPDFIQCEIMGFGHVKRSELIKKWYSLGDRESTLQEHELTQNRIRAEKIVSSLLGNNLIPPYPFFILAILQQMEIGTPVGAKSGSHGYLYEALLIITLSKIETNGIELDIIYSYLSKLGYYFYLNHISTLTEDKLREWHSNYCTKQKLLIDFERLITGLQKVSILKQNDLGYMFRYPYIYYYFTGKYMSEHIHEDEIKNHIAFMGERLHQTESANIVIFLCYLSKDPFILTTLLYASHVLFDNYNEFNIEADTKDIDDLFSDIAQLALTTQNPEKNHADELKIKDDLEQNDVNESRDKEDFLDERLDKELEEFLQINVAIKTIQILGQLLRNFPGSWDGDQKQELVQECYNLGLRVLRFAYNSIEDNHESIAQTIADLLRERYPKWDNQHINENVRKRIFNLLEGLSFIFIKHISDSVGHDRFSMTYNDLLQLHPENTTYEYIDLSIRLDYYKDFPRNQILNLAKRARKNGFANFLLKHLVWYYFYIYKAPLTLKQSICTKLGIPISPQLGKGQKPKLLNSGINS